MFVLRAAGARKASTNRVKELVRRNLRGLRDATVRVEHLLDVGGGAAHPYTVKITGRSSSTVVAKRESGESPAFILREDHKAIVEVTVEIKIF